MGLHDIGLYSIGSLSTNTNHLQVNLTKEFALENQINDVTSLSKYRKFRNPPILNFDTEACDCGCGFSFSTHKAHIANAQKLFMRNDEINILKNVISSNGNVNNHDLQKIFRGNIF